MTRRNAVLVGFGTRGRVWASSLRSHERWDLAGIVDIDDRARRSAGAAFGLGTERTFTSIDVALDGLPNVDAVIIATPHEHHVQPCPAAIDRGVPLLVEKPFATSLSDARSLVEKAAGSGVPLMVGQNYRYLRWVRKARELIQSGVIGRVGLVSVQYYRPWHDLEPSLQVVDDSILWGMGAHHVDTLRYLLGTEVIAVHAQSSTVFGDKRPLGATLQAILELQDGGRVSYLATYESSGQERLEGGREYFQRFVGDRGSLHVFNRWMFLARAGKLPRPVRRGPRGRTEEAVLLDHLEGAIATGVEPECSGLDNLATVAVLDACVRSAAEGQRIEIEEVWR